MKYKTEQENFWASEFGSHYAQRNQSEEMVAANLALFSEALRLTHNIDTLIEFGANVGLNLKAIKHLFPLLKQWALEINSEACKELRRFLPPEHIYNTSILEFEPNRKWDLVLIKGVLIHINPEEIKKVYELLFRSCNKYLFIAEYYNPTPMEVCYRGHKGRLFKRDFAGEIMDSYPELKLVDYGFVYHKAVNFSDDDINWFLMEKRL